MLSVPVFDMNGKRTGEVQIDPEILGGRVRHRLIKQAVVMYQDRQRQDSARTLTRSQVEGSNRKLYRQKGTGNARAGMVRTPVRRGGGRAFARQDYRFRKSMPKKMRQLARDSAILAKIRVTEAVVVDGLKFDRPKTKSFATLMRAIGAGQGCVLALHQQDPNTVLSGRNVAKTEIRVLEEMTAYDILRRRVLVFTKPAFEKLAGRTVA